MERIGTIVVAPSTERKAEPGRFGTALRTAAGEAASGIAGSLALAAPYVPGGAVLAGALRAVVPAPAYGGVVPAATSMAATAGGGSGLLTGAAASSAGGDVMEATRALQQQAQTFNLQYLQLQESMQQESRDFTALTNVMKVKHDSAKAAIGNIH